jgi:CheY-like chemotaxis protein
MHGEVWCESEPGKGASFIVTFPREDTGKAFINAAADSGELRGLRVLVVDDNAVHRHLVCEKLAAMGAAVESVGDGAAALELTDKGGIDAVVLDLHMPGIDGFDYIERLRAKPADGAAPLILATSATAMEADLQRLRRLGIDRFIAKPLSRQALRDHLQALVR